MTGGDHMLADLELPSSSSIVKESMDMLGERERDVATYNPANRSEEAHPSTRRRAGPNVSSI